MVTVLEKCNTEEQRSVVRFFLWAKGLNAKDIHKEMFPVHSGKCLSLKEVHPRSADNEKVETELGKWLRQQSKGFFYAAGFDALVKQWDKCINIVTDLLSALLSNGSVNKPQQRDCFFVVRDATVATQRRSKQTHLCGNWSTYNNEKCVRSFLCSRRRGYITREWWDARQFSVNLNEETVLESSR
jgi:hypothetical protein